MISMAISLPATIAQSPAACAAVSASYPRILDFDFSPGELILDNASSQIALLAHVADENGDIESIETVFSSPSQNQSIAAFMNSTNLLSGDARNGNYTTNLSFSPSNEEGIWTIKHLIVCDRAGDCRRINASMAEMLGFPAKLQVLKKAQNGDTISPPNSYVLPGSKEQTIDLGLDPNELRGWANTDKRFAAQRKIIINSVFNRPSICWP
ncbi:MAG: hypothetical protein QG575_1166 [Euryarchaeota archaeon]|nr:hypothetical protein [Euryarchaeota archaeon]